MLKKSQYTKGFTLLELLVVISIIGILMAMGVVAYSTAQKKGRDAKRRGDIQAIQDAQEQYYAANSGAYASDLDDLVSAGLLNSVPRDPRTGVEYDLAHDSANNLYCVCTGSLDESGTGNADSVGSATCNYSPSNDGAYYCLGNLQ